MWTEPSPAQQLAEQIQKQIDESRPYPQSYYDNIEKFNKQGWDKSEEIHKRKQKLFKQLEDPSISPSERANIMKEINSL
jgi:ABC-type Zn2+ transport system substrate-binding protein/surface adhesin